MLINNNNHIVLIKIIGIWNNNNKVKNGIQEQHMNKPLNKLLKIFTISINNNNNINKRLKEIIMMKKWEEEKKHYINMHKKHY